MATVINNPPNESNGSGMLIAVVVSILLVAAFIYVALPAIRQYGSPSVPQINVPDKIEVNVKESK